MFVGGQTSWRPMILPLELWSLEMQESFPRDNRVKGEEIWYGPLCLLELQLLLLHPPPPMHSFKVRPPLKPPFPPCFSFFGFFSWSLQC
ncbi:hypothetical protein GQ457_12G019240 [Hibiscus cannabinus]